MSAEPVVIRLVPNDREAEAALLVEVEELIAQGVLVERGRFAEIPGAAPEISPHVGSEDLTRREMEP